MSRNRLKKWGRGNQLLNWFKKNFTNYQFPRKYRTQRGIALPLVIGIGLLMMLLSTTIIARSQSSQVSTSNLKQAVQGGEAAEIGVARVQSLFTQYRLLPIFPLENKSATTTSWTEAAAKFPATCGSVSAPTTTLLNSIRKSKGNIYPATPVWVPIDSTRRFRVISYDYGPDPESTTKPGVGNLWVEGQIVSETSPLINPNPIVYSTSGLQVGIPVQPGNVLTIPIPGTWISSKFGNNSEKNEFQSDTLIGCGVTVTPNVTSPYTTTQSVLKLPNAPTPPTGTVDLGAINASSVDPYILPTTSGYNSATGGYEYKVTSIGKSSVYVNPNYKVTLYLQGNIDKVADITYTNTISQYPSGYPPYNVLPPTTTVTLTGPTAGSGFTLGASATVIPSNLTYLIPNGKSVYGNITYGTSGVPGKLSVSISGIPSISTYTFTPDVAATSGSISVPTGATFTPTTSFKSTDFKIYGNGPVGSSICINGNRDLYAFILAPNYAIGKTGNGVFYGAIWGDSWGMDGQCSASNSQLAIKQIATWDDLNGLTPVNLPPITQPIQTWIKKEGEPN
jgi:hypothetical protein